MVDADRDEITVRPPVEIDIVSAAIFDMLLSQAVALLPSRVIVDFARVLFLDTHAIMMLADAAKALSDSGSALEIRNPPRVLLLMAAATDTAELLALPDVRGRRSRREQAHLRLVDGEPPNIPG